VVAEWKVCRSANSLRYYEGCEQSPSHDTSAMNEPLPTKRSSTSPRKPHRQWYRYLGDRTLDENDVSYFNDDGFINDPTASGSGLQAGDSRLWRQLDSRIWRASRLRLSRTAPTKIRRPRIQISHRQHGYQRRHHQR